MIPNVRAQGGEQSERTHGGASRRGGRPWNELLGFWLTMEPRLCGAQVKRNEQAKLNHNFSGDLSLHDRGPLPIDICEQPKQRSHDDHDKAVNE